MKVQFLHKLPVEDTRSFATLITSLRFTRRPRRPGNTRRGAASAMLIDDHVFMQLSDIWAAQFVDMRPTKLANCGSFHRNLTPSTRFMTEKFHIGSRSFTARRERGSRAKRPA